MKKNNKVYIIGHKNPDTDSICSAIAYADIKNRTCMGEFIPKRAGQINEETEFVLNYFNMTPPEYLPNVGTQVKDMELHETPGAQRDMSVKNAWNLMREYNAVTLPVTNEDGTLEGLITNGDIAKSYMDAYDNTILAKGKPQYKSIAETLEGKVIVGNPEDYFTQGKVWIGASQPGIMEDHIGENDLVMVGNRMDDQLCVIDANASCMIVCLESRISKSIRRLAEEKM